MKLSDFVKRAWNGLASVLAFCLLGLIKAYQVVLSPMLGNQCRFYPTCSHYAADAVRCHGPWRGSLLAVQRILRCQPFAKGGMDPVPAATEEVA